MIGGIMVELQQSPTTLREFLGLPTIVVGAIMAILWLGLFALSLLAMWGNGVDGYAWEAATFVFWEFSIVLLFVAVLGTRITLATYGVTVFVRRVRRESATPHAAA